MRIEFYDFFDEKNKTLIGEIHCDCGNIYEWSFDGIICFTFHGETHFWNVKDESEDIGANYPRREYGVSIVDENWKQYHRQISNQGVNCYEPVIEELDDIAHPGTVLHICNVFSKCKKCGKDNHIMVPFEIS